jgi:hypothetical protein
VYSWKRHRIKRLFGLDLKTNVTDVRDGYSLDAENVYQTAGGVVSKRRGNEPMFATDDANYPPPNVDEIGSATLSGTKYWFKFVNGQFQYSTSRTGSVSAIAASVSTTNQIWWAVLDDKIFFVDGSGALKYFNGSAVKTSSIYQRPANAATGGGAGGFDYVYTVDNGHGESPASPANTGRASAATINVPNGGPYTLAAGDIVRVYSRATAVAAASKLVATYTWTLADVGAGSANITTVAINDDQPQLYSELGYALNKSAPTGLKGIIVHAGRLIGWKDDTVYVSKSSNPHSWPDENAPKEAFTYTYAPGDGEDIQTCISFLESVFVMKQTSIVIFVGIGPDDAGNNAFAFRRLETNGIGCVAPKSAVVVGDAGKSYLIWLSDQGFFGSTGDRPVRLGEPIENEIQPITRAIKQLAVAIYHKREGFYWCVIGAAGTRQAWVFDVREDGEEKLRVGWFKLADIDYKCIYWDEDRYIAGCYDSVCLSERIAGLVTDFRDTAHGSIDGNLVGPDGSAHINTTQDWIDLGNPNFANGTPIIFRSGVTSPLVAGTTYFLRKYGAYPTTKYYIYTTQFLAETALGPFIDLTFPPVGGTYVVNIPIEAFYSTNWMHFGSPSHTKKIGKLSVTLNAAADSVRLDVDQAVDWNNSYTSAGSVITASTELWGGEGWGSFVWGESVVAGPKNVAVSRRKVRSVRYKFKNAVIDQDFNLQGFEQAFDVLRNRGFP